MTWTCLYTTPDKQKHPLFDRFITSQTVLEELASTVSLVFAPGLFEVLKAAATPTIQFFKTLPTDTTKCWAVYLLVLEKSNHRARIYMGSGTSAERGVYDRFYQYDALSLLPKYVAKAVDEGYEIVQKGLICWIPIPSAALQPRVRLLFLALEATFAYMFWAMTAVTKDYGMAHICLWDRDTFEYDGICSHCSLNEGIVGDFDLSPEELEALAVQRKENRAAKQAVYASDYHHKQMETNREAYYDYKLEKQLQYRHADPEKYSQQQSARGEKHLENKTYYCEDCKKAYTTYAMLKKHKGTRSHLQKAKDLATMAYVCKPCVWASNFRKSYTDHLKSKRHAKMAPQSSSSELD